MAASKSSGRLGNPGVGCARVAGRPVVDDSCVPDLRYGRAVRLSVANYDVRLGHRLSKEGPARPLAELLGLIHLGIKPSQAKPGQADLGGSISLIGISAVGP